MKQKYFRCSRCGNIVASVHESGVPVMCCGEKMAEIIPGTTEASVEKHLPVIVVRENIVEVSVGSVEHPMTPEHYIEWISISTKEGNQRKALLPTDKPFARFALTQGDEVLSAYAYCNLHSLWKTDL